MTHLSVAVLFALAISASTAVLDPATVAAHSRMRHDELCGHLALCGALTSHCGQVLCRAQDKRAKVELPPWIATLDGFCEVVPPWDEESKSCFRYLCTSVGESTYHAYTSVDSFCTFLELWGLANSCTSFTTTVVAVAAEQ